ncbi:MAG: hypothetical protein U0838_07655 [Chloroflexota bacterium]
MLRAACWRTVEIKDAIAGSLDNPLDTRAVYRDLIDRGWVSPQYATTRSIDGTRRFLRVNYVAKARIAEAVQS